MTSFLSFSGSLTATVISPIPVSAVVARRIKALRGERSMTQRDLAARLEALGVRIDQSRIARVEREVASLDVAEAVAVALALEVSLDALLTPSNPYEKVALTPTIVVTREQMEPWLSSWESLVHSLAQLEVAMNETARLSSVYTRAATELEALVSRSPEPDPRIVELEGLIATVARQVDVTVEAVGEMEKLLENPLMPSGARTAVLDTTTALRDILATLPRPNRHIRHVAER